MVERNDQVKTGTQTGRLCVVYTLPPGIVTTVAITPTFMPKIESDLRRIGAYIVRVWDPNTGKNCPVEHSPIAHLAHVAVSLY